MGMSSLFAVVCFVGVSFAEDFNKPRLDESRIMLAKKADLIVENIKLTKIDQKPRLTMPGTGKEIKNIKHKVQITVKVKNNAIGPQAASTENSLTAEGRRRGCGGAFKVLVEWTDDPTRGFNYLAEGGATSLAPGASKTLSFSQWVNQGTNRKYRVTVDHLNWINEWNEGNNVSSAGYMAR